MKIYVVTTIGDIIDNGKDKFPDITHKRSVGFYTNLEDAKRCVENNNLDINESGYYKFAAIEEVKEGLYGSCDPHTIFYKWETDRYIETERPACTECYVGFSEIG